MIVFCCQFDGSLEEVEYDPKPLKKGDQIGDYVEGVHEELVPMYYIFAQLQFRPLKRMPIQLFSCGGVLGRIVFRRGIPMDEEDEGYFDLKTTLVVEGGVKFYGIHELLQEVHESL